jgi:hypothetical protein
MSCFERLLWRVAASARARPASANGTKQTCPPGLAMSVIEGKADVPVARPNVCK